jgi:enoyl-CoA hydratase
MNALSRELRGELASTFGELHNDDSIRVVILTGAGKAFCAGLDLKELAGSEAEAGQLAGDDGIRVVTAMRKLDKPIIGAINGFAITGGFELALACDVLVCSSDAKFADTHARIGIMPGWGLSQILCRVIGPYRARELSLTGNFLDAETADRWGLVNRVVAPEVLIHTCLDLARDMLSCDPVLQREYKRNIDQGWEMTYADGRRLESARFRAHVQTLTANAIAERRAEVTERGRDQGGG